MNDCKCACPKLQTWLDEGRARGILLSVSPIFADDLYLTNRRGDDVGDDILAALCNVGDDLVPAIGDSLESASPLDALPDDLLARCLAALAPDACGRLCATSETMERRLCRPGSPTVSALVAAVARRHLPISVYLKVGTLSFRGNSLKQMFTLARSL